MTHAISCELHTTRHESRPYNIPLHVKTALRHRLLELVTHDDKGWARPHADGKAIELWSVMLRDTKRDTK